MLKVVLDPGHGGNSRSNRGPTGYIEADGVLDISLKTRDLIRKKFPQVQVFLTRDKDMTLDPAPRVAKVNSFKADICISLHSNAGPESARGTEVIHSIFSKPYTGGHKLALLLQKNIVSICGTYDRGIKTVKSKHGKDYYFMIRDTKPSAAIVEYAFHSNREDEALLKNEAFRYKCAIATAKSIAEYFGLEWLDEAQVIEHFVYGTKEEKFGPYLKPEYADNKKRIIEGQGYINTRIERR